eukprot:gene32700-43704_t
MEVAKFEDDENLRALTISVLKSGKDYFEKIDKLRSKMKHHWKTRKDVEEKPVMEWLKITAIDSLELEAEKELVRLYLANRYARKRTKAQQEIHDQGKIYGAPTTEFLPIPPDITKKSGGSGDKTKTNIKTRSASAAASTVSPDSAEAEEESTITSTTSAVKAGSSASVRKLFDDEASEAQSSVTDDSSTSVINTRLKTTKVVKPIRDRADEEQLYETPIAVTEKMLDLAIEYGLLPNNTCFWEAAKGRGKMVEPIEARKYKCIATDLYHGTPSVDFLTAPVPDGVTAILTNFPFKNKAKFFERLAELGLPFILLGSLESVVNTGCNNAMRAMGGVNAHILNPMPTFLHDGEVVTPEKTVVFVGNMPTCQKYIRSKECMIAFF